MVDKIPGVKRLSIRKQRGTRIMFQRNVRDENDDILSCFIYKHNFTTLCYTRVSSVNRAATGPISLNTKNIFFTSDIE